MGGDPDGSAARERRLDEAVAEYLLEAEAGRPPDPQRFLASYPDLADDLAEFLDDRALFGRFVSLVPPRAAGSSAADVCPHCHGRFARGPGTAGCPGCGARFRVDQGDPKDGPVHRLGRFELTAVAGRGAFGTVYKAWDPVMAQAVAVKVPRQGALTTAEDIDRFFREARFALQLHHPNIVRVYEVGEDGGVPYLVSEFVAGRTLADLLRDHRPPPDRAAGIVAVVADALHHAHRAGVVHRDIKPSNILLRCDGVPVLTDFGLARQDGHDPTLTLDGEVLGTAAYMSPEQARGRSHKADGRSDVYSLGVVLYQLLTGQQPFVGNVRMVLHQIVEDEPRPPRSLNDQLTRDLETVCLKCLRKDPARRYQTAAELAEDLRRCREGKQIQARPEGRFEKMARWLRRNPALAAAVGLAASLLVATAAVSVAWATHSNLQAEALQEALQESKRVQAESHLDRGLAEASRGDVGAGMLWLIRSLEACPPRAEELAWAARANLAGWRRQLSPLTDCVEAPPGRVLAFEADGRTACWVVLPDGQSVRRWDLNARRFDGPVLEHGGQVVAVAVSRDGKRVATGGSDRTRPVRLWDPRTGEGRPMTGPRGDVRGLAFFPDGKELLTAEVEVTAAERKGRTTVTTVRTWGLAADDAAGPPFQIKGRVEVVALRPDGRAVFTASRLGKLVSGYELPSGRPLADWSLPHPIPVRALAVSPDGRHMVTAGDDRAARVWDMASGRLLNVLNHRDEVSAVGFTSAGQTFLTASPGDAVRVWGVGSDPRAPAPPGRPGIRALAVSPGGDLVATASDDCFVRLWGAGAGKLAPLGSLPKHPSQVKSLAFSPDGGVLATSMRLKPSATLWEVATGRRWVDLGHPAHVHHIVFSPDGKLVATAGFDREVRVWATDTGRPAIPAPLRHDGTVLAAAFSPGGQVLVVGGENGTARRWDTATWAPLAPDLPHGGEVWVVAFSPDGGTILTAGGAAVRLWRSDTGAPLGPALVHGPRVQAAAFSPDGRTVVTAGWDHTGRFWDAQTGQGRGPPLRHADRVWSAGIDPTGRWAATVSEDGTARMWGVGTGRPLGPPLVHQAEVKCAGFDPRGRWVVTAGLDGQPRLWPAPEAPGHPVQRLALWVRAETGAELDPGGVVRALTPQEWRRARQLLEEMGGPPAGPGD